MTWLYWQRVILTIVSCVALVFGFFFIFIDAEKIGIQHGIEFSFIIAITAFIVTIFIPIEKIEKEPDIK